MDHIGSYHTKPYSKYRKNISLITSEGWKKHNIHSLIEVDVTEARKKIHDIKKQTGKKLSFTAWLVKCVADALHDHTDINAYRKGRKKIICFQDIDIPIPIERVINDEPVPMAYIIRKADTKSVVQITDEIRQVQQHTGSTNTQVLGEDYSSFERFVIGAPFFIKKIFLWMSRHQAFLKKKHMGTVGVSAIGMKGQFPGWIIPLGGTTTMLFIIGGISKKPGVINDTIAIREFLHVTITADHDVIDGGPLVRFIDQFISYCEQGYSLPTTEN